MDGSVKLRVGQGCLDGIKQVFLKTLNIIVNLIWSSTESMNATRVPPTGA